MPSLSVDGHEAHHGHTDIRLFSWISCKNHWFWKVQPLPSYHCCPFPQKGKWNDDRLDDSVKSTVIQPVIYREAQPSRNPVFCIVDDTISSKTKPSSQAFHPIEDVYFHQSHLKGKQDYGHHAVAVMLSCNGIVLNYAIIMYDKSRSKVKIVQEIANELSVPPMVPYFLCNSWYTRGGIMDAFIKKGFYTIGALKTNRILYPCGIKQKISEFALHIRKTDSNVILVTVCSLSYYAYRYEGSLNGIDNAVVLISYPKDAFHVPGALRAFERISFIYQCGKKHILFEEVLALMA